jgi:hypothetical protein
VAYSVPRILSIMAEVRIKNGRRTPRSRSPLCRAGKRGKSTGIRPPASGGNRYEITSPLFRQEKENLVQHCPRRNAERGGYPAGRLAIERKDGAAPLADSDLGHMRAHEICELSSSREEGAHQFVSFCNSPMVDLRLVGCSIALACRQEQPIDRIVPFALRLAPLKIEQRAPERTFDARLVPGQLRDVVML